jgi:N utilization substance protein B
MLSLMVAVNRIAERAVETAQSRNRRLGEGVPPSTKFIDNRFMAQLQTNQQLQEFTEDQKKTWSDEDDFVRRLYKQVIESDVYKEWMADDRDTTYEEDRDFWRRLYRAVFVENEDLDQILEDKSLYWNDDRFIVDTFVLKTIKRFDPKMDSRQQLMPEFKDEEDREFATRLFRASLLGAENYRMMISQMLHNWDLNRLALMDLIILQTALAEICTFPNIPISVSINEYVEIAKMYSTPQSGRYVNGLLDAIARYLIESGKLQKEMPPARGEGKA